MNNLEKEDLIQVIYNHNKNLKESIGQLEKDIAYQNDILKINEKHNKDTYKTKNEIEKLKIMLEILENIQDDFKENMEENDISIEEIIKECE